MACIVKTLLVTAKFGPILSVVMHTLVLASGYHTVLARMPSRGHPRPAPVRGSGKILAAVSRKNVFWTWASAPPQRLRGAKNQRFTPTAR